MTLAQLTNFIRVVELGSLTKAAAIVRIAQPALSRQIRNLEAELGAELLIRHGWGVTATDAGQLLLEYARRIIHNVEEARDAVDALSAEPTGRIALGVPATLATSLLPPLALVLRDKFPRLKPRFVDDFSQGLHARVHSGELDMALLYAERTIGPVATAPLLEEDLMLIASARTSGNLLEQSHYVVSARPSRLREIVDGVLSAHGIRDSALLEVDSLPAIVGMVLRGVGCTILPYSTVADEVDRGDLIAIPLPGEQPRRTLVLARALDRPASAATRAVESELRSIVSDLAVRYRWRPADGPEQG